ncbi:hypothetical protein, partial [Pseudoalteromonas sp. PS5]|uniref:hypothetical protein n=1 Tax=Pseudoalteromonas sp. PS5 TaxID=1437473 RepID=UPI001024D832
AQLNEQIWRLQHVQAVLSPTVVRLKVDHLIKQIGIKSKLVYEFELLCGYYIAPRITTEPF